MRLATYLAAFMIAAFTMTVSAAAQQKDQYACLDELPQLLGEVKAGVFRLFFCEDFAEGVEISLRKFYAYGQRRYDQGGGPALMRFRHNNYLAKHDNRLETILVQRTKELWDVTGGIAKTRTDW